MRAGLKRGAWYLPTRNGIHWSLVNLLVWEETVKELPSLFCLLTLVSAKGWGCPAKASLTVVSQMWGSWNPRAVTMNWTGSDRLATSCSAYTVPSDLTLKLGSLLTKPTSLLRWQSSNFTKVTDRKRERWYRIREQHSEIYFMRCSQILDTSGRFKINPHPSRHILKYLIPSAVTTDSLLSSLWQNKLLIWFWTGIHREEVGGGPNSFSSHFYPKLDG